MGAVSRPPAASSTWEVLGGHQGCSHAGTHGRMQGSAMGVGGGCRSVGVSQVLLPWPHTSYSCTLALASLLPCTGHKYTMPCMSSGLDKGLNLCG